MKIKHKFQSSLWSGGDYTHQLLMSASQTPSLLGVPSRNKFALKQKPKVFWPHGVTDPKRVTGLCELSDPKPISL
ncbi:hypothetical protein J6590_072895 [Homalodisca vitripennis]|nr:hypothetical protein J6590_072895 [Homalodisca vitripennis]